MYDTTNKEFLEYGTVQTNAKKDTTERIHDLRVWFESYVKKHEPDIIIIEDIQYQSNQRVYKVLASLLGVLTESCIENKLEYKIVPSVKWKSKMGVSSRNRKESKKESIAIASNLVNETVHEDTADAICIAYSEMINSEK